jgi:hypothetical protein
MRLNWYRTINSSRNSEYIQSSRYTCGYCGEPLASDVGYAAFDVNEDKKSIGVSVAKIYICHHCSSSTYFDRNGVQGGQFFLTPQQPPSL